MKFNRLYKAIPFVLTLLLIIILGVNNQKQNTKIKLLIWNTPLLPIGTYIAISTCSGFVLSFLVTASIAKLEKHKSQPLLKYKSNTFNEDTNEEIRVNDSMIYDNNLIERDVKDPTPTIKAKFRVIGNINQDKNKYSDSYSNSNSNSNYNNKTRISIEEEERNKIDNQFKNKSNNNRKNFIDDWNENDYANW